MLLKARTTSLFGVPAGNMLLLLRLLLLGALPTALADVASVVDCTNAGVVGDAGSTGTRIYVVYNMTSDAGSPVIETIGKQQGGLAKVGAQAAFAGGLAELLREAYARLKALGCTAGKQRSLEEMSALMSSSQDSLQPNNHNRNISSSSSSSTIAALGEAGLLPPSMFEVGAGAELEDGEPFDYPVLPLGSLAEFSGHQNTAKPVSGGAVMGFLAVFGDMYEWLSQMMNSMSHWTPSGGGGKSSGKGGKNASGLREDAGSSGGFSASAAAEGKVGEVSSSSSNSKEHDSNSPANVNAAEEEGGDDDDKNERSIEQEDKEASSTSSNDDKNERSIEQEDKEASSTSSSDDDKGRENKSSKKDKKNNKAAANKNKKNNTEDKDKKTSKPKAEDIKTSNDSVENPRRSLSASPGTRPAPLAILGTAGTRLLSATENAQLWADVKRLVSETERKYNIQFQVLQLRTLSGEEEGFSAFISVNVLRGAVSHDLRMLERKMHGVVDLGGASTQVAVPERVAVGEKLKQSDIFVRSFLGYGMKEFYTHAPATVKEHCKFGGKASDCQDSIWSVFQSRIVDGKSYVQDKLSYFGKDDLQTIQQGDGHTDSVYSISAYYFVSQLLRSFKLLKAPPSQKISIADYNTATEALCAMSLTDVTKEYDKEETHVSGKHTTPEQLSDRCFDACYVVVLLSKLYKWSTTAPKFHFTDNVHGNSVDWPLGAYVSLITGGMGGQQQFSKPATGTSGQSTSTSGSAATTSSDEAAAASSTAITTGGRTGRGAVLPVRPESSPGVVRTRPAPIVLPPSGIIRGQSTSSSEKATEATTSSYWLRNLFAAALASGLLYFLYRKLRRNVSGDGHAQPLTRYDLEHGPDDEFGMLNDKELPTLPPERSVPGRVY